MPSEAIEALLRAADAMGHEHYCNRIVGGKCECNVRELDEAAAAVRADLAREPVELSDRELRAIYNAAFNGVDITTATDDCLLLGLRAVARAARGEK